MSFLGHLAGSILPAAGAMAGGVFGPLIGAAGAGLGSYFANKESMSNQKSLMAYQSQLDQANWIQRFNMQNEYNTPTAMRQRLKDAGMNENLVYGALSPNMAANPSTSAPNAQLSKYQTAMEASLAQQQIASNAKDIELKDKDLEVKDSEIKLNNARAWEAHSNAGKLQADSEQQRRYNKMLEEAQKWNSYNPYANEQYREDQQRAINAWNHENTWFYRKLEYDLDVEQWTQQKKEIKAQIDAIYGNLAIQKRIADKQARYLTALTDKAVAEGRVLDATETSIVIRNGIDAIKFKYMELSTVLDIVGKMEHNELTRQQAITEIKKQYNISADTASKMIRTGQSLVKQFATAGLSY